MIGTKNELKELLFSLPKNCETHKKQTHSKPQETLEFKLTQPREYFYFRPSNNIGLCSKWMVGFTSFQVYTSNFDITKENNKFDFFADSFDEFSHGKSKYEPEEILNISHIPRSIYKIKY